MIDARKRQNTGNRSIVRELTPGAVTDGGAAVVEASLQADGAVSVGEERTAEETALSTGHRWGKRADEAELPLNTVFEIAKNERRQLVLRYLDAQDGPVSLGELAEYIASYENGKPVSAITSAERKRVYVGLYQCHLPKMEDAKVVEVDRQEGITLGRHAREVLDVLESDGEDRWYLYYGTVAAVGTVLFLVAQLGAVRPLAHVVLGGYVAIVAATALLHARTAR